MFYAVLVENLVIICSLNVSIHLIFGQDSRIVACNIEELVNGGLKSNGLVII